MLSWDLKYQKMAHLSVQPQASLLSSLLIHGAICLPDIAPWMVAQTYNLGHSPPPGRLTNPLTAQTPTHQNDHPPPP